MTRTEKIIYTAGFFDGEGNIAIVRNTAKSSKHGAYYALRISASQISPEPLELFKELYGGTLKEYSAANPRWRDHWEWRASAGPAIVALTLMLPYLTVKASEAKLAIEFQTRRGVRRPGHAGNSTEVMADDEQDYLVMRELKRLY